MKKIFKIATTVSLVSIVGLGVLSQQQEANAVVFHSCDDAWRAGYADIPIGEYGYRPGLDRDHDNVACELENDVNNLYTPRVEQPAQPVETPQVEQEKEEVQTEQIEVKDNNKIETSTVSEQKVLPQTSAVK